MTEAEEFVGVAEIASDARGSAQLRLALHATPGLPRTCRATGLRPDLETSRCRGVGGAASSVEARPSPRT